ncbi:unnamed protein product [Phytophthora lilii]|uniref:Unnamed protein product n=1 Tax=Phytophthora lilii TaxID=2077276 RepID=A0A9W6TMS7_9STRA|nr:unnamed protein product [Phytophthora lilii]
MMFGSLLQLLLLPTIASAAVTSMTSTDIGSTDASPPMLEKTWTVSAATLDKLEVQVAGNVFVDVDDFVQEDEQVVAKVVMQASTPQLLQAVEVSEIGGDSAAVGVDSGVRLHYGNQPVHVEGLVTTQILLSRPNLLRAISATNAQNVVLGVNVVVENDKAARLHFSTQGNGHMFVGSQANTSFDVRSVSVFVSGDGGVQFQSSSLQVAEELVVSLVGSGHVAVTAQDSVKANKVESAVAGTGKVLVETAALEVETLATEIVGNGEVTYTAGTCTNQMIHLAGEGSVNSGSIASKETDISILGTGEAVVQATDRLSAMLLLTGSIKYVNGRPKSIQSSGLVLGSSIQSAEAIPLEPFMAANPPNRAATGVFLTVEAANNNDNPYVHTKPVVESNYAALIHPDHFSPAWVSAMRFLSSPSASGIDVNATIASKSRIPHWAAVQCETGSSPSCDAKRVDAVNFRGSHDVFVRYEAPDGIGNEGDGVAKVRVIKGDVHDQKDILVQLRVMGELLTLDITASKKTVEVVLFQKDQLQRVVNQGSGDIVVEDNVLATMGPSLSIATLGSGDVFATTTETVKVDTLILSSKGSGLLQTSFADIRVSKLLVEYFASGDIALFTESEGNADSMAVVGEGSGDACLSWGAPMSINEFQVEKVGSGDVLAGPHGSCQAATLSMQGSGSLDVGGVLCDSVDVDLMSSGKVVVHATSSLAIEAYGSGDVKFIGKAPQTVDSKGYKQLYPTPVDSSYVPPICKRHKTPAIKSKYAALSSGILTSTGPRSAGVELDSAESSSSAAVHTDAVALTVQIAICGIANHSNPERRPSQVIAMSEVTAGDAAPYWTVHCNPDESLCTEDQALVVTVTGSYDVKLRYEESAGGGGDIARVSVKDGEPQSVAAQLIEIDGLPVLELSATEGELDVVILRKERIERISNTGSGDVSVHDNVLVTSGPSLRVSAIGSGDVFLRSAMTIAVDELSLSTQGSGRLQASFSEFNVQTVLVSVYSSGGAAIIADSKGVVKDKIVLSAEGSGSLCLTAGSSLDANYMSIDKIGSGDLKLGPQGSCQDAKLTMAGSGTLDAGGIRCHSVDVDLLGSGNVVVQANESLSGDVYGSGHLKYFGAAPHSISNVNYMGLVVATAVASSYQPSECKVKPFPGLDPTDAVGSSSRAMGKRVGEEFRYSVTIDQSNILYLAGTVFLVALVLRWFNESRRRAREEQRQPLVGSERRPAICRHDASKHLPALASLESTGLIMGISIVNDCRGMHALQLAIRPVHRSVHNAICRLLRTRHGSPPLCLLCFTPMKLALLAFALSAAVVDGSLSVSSTEPTRANDTNGAFLEKVWTVNGEEGDVLDDLKVQVAGNVFLDYDASLRTADGGVAAKVIMRSGSPDMIDIVDVAVHEAEGSGIRVYYKNKNARAVGEVVTQIIVSDPNAFSSVSAVHTENLVVGNGVVVTNDPAATLALDTSSDAEIFVGSLTDDHFSLKAIDIASSGDGHVQMLASSIQAGTISVSLSGDSKAAIVATDRITVDSINSAVSGDGKIFVQTADLEAQRLSASLSGDGKVSYSSAGSCVDQSIHLSGDASVYAGSIVCKNSAVSISGDGKAIVQTTDTLTSVGEGSVKYVNAPPRRVVAARSIFRKHSNVKRAKYNKFKTHRPSSPPTREPTELTVVLKAAWFGDSPHVSVYAGLEPSIVIDDAVLAVAGVPASQHGVGLFGVFMMVAVVAAIVGAVFKFSERHTRKQYAPLV